MTYVKIDAKVRIAELSGSANEMINFLEGEDLSSYPDYMPIVDSLRELSLQLTSAINQSNALSNLADLDAVRDKRISAINISLQAALLADDAQIQAQAAAVWEVFKKYGTKINKLSYAAQSANVQSLLEELSASSLQAAIAGLPFLDGHIAALATAQADFEAAELAYDERISQERNRSTASSLKPQLLQVISAMVNYHNALVDFKGEHFKQLADFMDGIIRELNNNTQARRAKK